MVKPLYKESKSRPALYLLILCGAATMFFALILIGCSFAINYDEDFEFDDDAMEAFIKIRFNYMQYWAGIPFFISGTLVLFSGIFQRSRKLTITSVIFCLISIMLTMLVLALESGNFVWWNSQERAKAYWDSKSGYSCGTDDMSKMCKCSATSPSPTVSISIYECNVVRKLSAFYGAIIASAIMVTLFSLAAIVVTIKLLSWKQLAYSAPSYFNSAGGFHDSGRRASSYIDLPEAKQTDNHLEVSSGNQRLPYRNYPF